MSSDEEAVVSVKKKKFVVDSDSDEEEGQKMPNRETIKSVEEKEEIDIKGNSKPKNKRKINRLKQFEDSSSDGDSDEEKGEKQSDSEAQNSALDKEEIHSDEDNRKIQKERRIKRLKRFESYSSGSDSEKENSVRNSKDKSKSTENIFQDEKTKDDSDSLLNTENSKVLEYPKTEVNDTLKKSWYKNSDLFEDESSGAENDHHSDNEDSDGDGENISNRNSRRTISDDDEPARKSKGKAKKPVQERAERKSKKKAQEEIAEIHKETQRMLRDSRVSIPYHRPRQRTLAEFLERRKCSPSVSLKTSAEQLQSAWKALEEREKEAEIFYKSESSEEETEKEVAVQSTKETTPSIPGNVTETDVSKSSEKNLPETNVSSNVINEETSKMEVSELYAEGNEESISETRNNSDLNKEMVNEDKCNEPLSENNAGSIDTTDPDTARTIETSVQTDKMNIENITEDSEGSSTPVVEKSSVKANLDQEEIKVTSSNEPTREIATSEVKRLSGNTENFSLRLSESFSEGESFSHLPEKVKTKNAESEKPNQDLLIDKACSENVSIANTEEFSLRMSESQSENLLLSKDGETVLCNQSIGQKSEMANEPNENLANSSLNRGNEEKMDTDSNLTSADVDKHETVVDKTQSPNEKVNDSVAESLEQKLKDKYNFEPKQPKVSLKMKEPVGGVINLEEGGLKPGVNELINRFQTHMSYKKKPTKKKTQLELSVVSAETDASGHVTSVTEEMVKVLVGGEGEEEDPSLAKPGAKLARLKAHLQAEMGRQRDQQWAEKQKETKLYEEEIYEDEKDVCDMEKEAEEDDSEAEAENKESEGDETEEEEEEEEEEEMEEKPKKKSVFVDDEAEESDDDNDDEEDEEDTFIKRPEKKKVILQKTPTADMFWSQEVLKQQNTEEEDLPPFQKPQPVEDKTEDQLSEASSVCASPAFPLTGLEGKANNYNWSAPTTPCKDFANPKTVTPVRLRAQLLTKSPQMGTQDLENLCSGEFTTQATQELEENQDTEDFKLFIEEDSQLTSETTPVKLSPNTQNKTPDEKEQMRSLLTEDEEDLPSTLVSKKVKKLNFSDDEDESDNEQDEKAEESDAPSEEEAEEQEDAEGGDADDVAYDSEENEVVKTAGEFLDKEAELSESEWGSEDEDEHGLDALEMEEADREKIDQRKLKRQLDQMHMKQMLIEDKKQVRMLQEVLLEDGELHSESKRQRLFRWSNNTAFTEEDNKARLDSDEEKGEDDEDEEHWRRTRHEREQYLLEHKKKVEKLELEFEEQSDSQLLRLGQKALKRMNSNSQEPRLTPPVNNPLASPDAKQPYRQLTTRGSFLARGERVLSRLGQMTSSDGPINQPKNSRNFVFSRVSPTKDQEESKPLAVVQPNKRKKLELPLPIAKKPCIQKPKTANKKSLFDALFKVKS